MTAAQKHAWDTLVVKIKADGGRVDHMQGHQCVLEYVTTTTPTDEAYLRLGDNPRLASAVREAQAFAMKNGQDDSKIGGPDWMYEQLRPTGPFKQLVDAIKDSGDIRVPVRNYFDKLGHQKPLDGSQRTLAGYELGIAEIPTIIFNPEMFNEKQQLIMLANIHIKDIDPWAKANQSKIARRMIAAKIPIPTIAKQLRTKPKFLEQWIISSDLQERSENETGMFDARNFAAWMRFVDGKLYAAMENQGPNGKIWRFISYAISNGKTGWTGKWNGDDLDFIYKNDNLRKELEPGGAGMVVLAPILEARKVKGEIEKLAKTVKTIPAMCEVAADKLDVFKNNDDARLALISDLSLSITAEKLLLSQLASYCSDSKTTVSKGTA